MSIKCANCQSEEMHTDSARGSVYCGECGMVQEENIIVSSLNFGNDGEKSTLHGKIVNVENTNIGTSYTDSGFYIKNTIGSICMRLSLGTDHADCAYRWYKLCLQYSLSKGKSILYTLSACVYITCRQESTPHLLIDFSNELRIDMYKIGKVFLKLRNLLGIDVPLVDPSLYMHRFVSQLKFTDSSILDYSIRLLSRMKKDWISEGRRPNNTCGAAILIASRVFGEAKDIRDIAKVVKASPSTVCKRIKEIAETESANLGISEFKSVWLDEEENPPVIKRRKIKKKTFEDVICTKIEETADENELIQMCIYQTPLELMDYESEFEEKASGEDNFDVDEMILTEHEIKDKTELWEYMYGDFEITKEKSKKIVKKAHAKNKKKKHNFDTIEEAFLSLDRKISSKLNYKAIENLFTD
ncbi:transcription factor IIIB 90 kDa subunit [Enteropsectra breve]|nr:transcription factor IIIB 90 kDa subunit [Enteropsectra breve]